MAFVRMSNKIVTFPRMTTLVPFLSYWISSSNSKIFLHGELNVLGQPTSHRALTGLAWELCQKNPSIYFHPLQTTALTSLLVGWLEAPVCKGVLSLLVICRAWFLSFSEMKRKKVLCFVISKFLPYFYLWFSIKMWFFCDQVTSLCRSCVISNNLQ